jgi:uncharacterized protein (TIGR02147 family)
MTVFQYEDYKAYLQAIETQRSHVQRGFRSRIASTINCQNAYVSRVLNGDAHFSLEQGMALSQFLELNKLEKKYFLGLIEFARAGTPDLKSYFKDNLDQLREKNLDMKARLKDVHTMSPEAQTRFYSHWLYGAIHLLPTLKSYTDISAIARALQISPDAAREIVLFLISCGLIEEQRGKLKPGPTQLHLEKNSPYINQHHTNWRIAALHSLVEKTPETDIHYSTVSTLSVADAKKLRRDFFQLIESYVATVRESPEQTLMGFNLDFYSLLKA